jgi:hypothetical protein
MTCKYKDCKNLVSRNWFCTHHQVEMSQLYSFYKNGDVHEELDGRIIYASKFGCPSEYFSLNLGHARRVVDLLNDLINNIENADTNVDDDDENNNPSGSKTNPIVKSASINIL